MLAAAQLQQTTGWTPRRDNRHKVLIRTRMRAGGLPVDVCIRDVSARGLCLVSNTPPVRGTIVELTGSHAPIVGRVVWASELRFGIEARGRIDVAAMVCGKGAAPRPDAAVPPPGYVARALPARAADSGRLAGNAMQFLFMAFLAGCAATFIGQTLYETLAGTSAAVAAGLE